MSIICTWIYRSKVKKHIILIIIIKKIVNLSSSGKGRSSFLLGVDPVHRRYDDDDHDHGVGHNDYFYDVMVLISQVPQLLLISNSKWVGEPD